ncbi:putative methylase [Podospora aff. communis PSN243]|uniref:Methylase n=1 Tax=Podospora aff. communis PSN243 TaxID=3040156 RepID=A0AAV9G3X9_9PEZI|nr:putative methylase [Podospora aff. communis PSN243]
MSEPHTAPPATSDHTTQAADIIVDPAFIVDGDNDAIDSESTLSSTASLSSSIYNYRKVHGRTFQNFKDVDHWAPNDDAHNDALDLHHHMTLLLHDDKLHVAPIENPKRVLDVGTGTGIWAIDFADQYPSAQVIGTDLSPTQPAWTPPNCKFELEDATLEWTFPDNSFDFVHISYLLGCIEDWQSLYEQVYRCLKPGGWFEHTDFTIRIGTDDNSIPDDSPYPTWNKFFEDAGKKRGRTFNVVDGNQQADWMKTAGFATSSIRVTKYKLPIGEWPADKRWKAVGAYNLAGSLQGLEGYGIYLGTEVLGWNLDDLKVLFARMRKDMTNKSIHAHYPAATAYAQKPVESHGTN